MFAFMSNRSETARPQELDRIHDLLNRPIEQRRLEFRYRCAQAAIFGLPVLVLEYFGPSLGGSAEESRRWLAVFQALLAGWVTYIAAAGMLAEGILTIRRGPSPDLMIALLSVALYLFSAVSVTGIFFTGVPLYSPLFFHVVVLMLAGWCGYRWWRLASL